MKRMRFICIEEMMLTQSISCISPVLHLKYQNISFGIDTHIENIYIYVYVPLFFTSGQIFVLI